MRHLEDQHDELAFLEDLDDSEQLDREIQAAMQESADEDYLDDLISEQDEDLEESEEV